MLRFFLIAAMGLSLSGCVGVALGAASILGADEAAKGTLGKAERRSATIAALGEEGQNLVARHIEIEDVQKTDGQESWTAETVIGNYRCTVLSGRSDATCTKL